MRVTPCPKAGPETEGGVRRTAELPFRIAKPPRACTYVENAVPGEEPDSRNVELPEISGAGLDASEDANSAKDLWAERNYCWVVICKNRWFHHNPNAFSLRSLGG